MHGHDLCLLHDTTQYVCRFVQIKQSTAKRIAVNFGHRCTGVLSVTGLIII